MGLIRSLLWFLLFVFFTFSFIVLFEYGPNDFVAGFQKELQNVSSYIEKTIKPEKKKDDAKP